jgi:hypothetical protein
MSLGIYTAPDSSSLISQNNTFTNALLVAVNGRLGGVYQKRLYVRNDESDRSYSDIEVLVENPDDETLIDGTQNILWKLIPGDAQPADDDWMEVTTGNSISLDDIGTDSVSDSTTYLPFWLYVKVPRNTSINTLTGVNLLINAIEILIV